MKMNKTLIAAIGVLVLAGATAVVLVNPNPGAGLPTDEPAAGNRKAAAAGSGLGRADDNPARPGERSRTRRAPANADLVAKDGEARTNLSKHVSTNIAGLPKMELEKLDSSIESARKITTGIKTMMDGMGGLREMMPPQQAPAGQ